MHMNSHTHMYIPSHNTQLGSLRSTHRRMSLFINHICIHMVTYTNIIIHVYTYMHIHAPT